MSLISQESWEKKKNNLLAAGGVHLLSSFAIVTSHMSLRDGDRPSESGRSQASHSGSMLTRLALLRASASMLVLGSPWTSVAS